MNPYLKFWDLDRPLFTRVEPVTALYLSDRLLAPLERLALTCGQDATLALLTGEAGTGKTTLLRWLAQRLPPIDYDILMTTIIHRETGNHWLLPRIAEHLGVTDSNTYTPGNSIIRAIADRLDEYLDSGRKIVLMIDAAHLIIGESAFDEIIALINLQAVAGGCISCILCGNEQLNQNLQKVPELTARTAYELQLPRLTPDETNTYLRSRIQTANAKVIFENEAVELLHAASRGLIASLNVHAEGCLIAAYQTSSSKITAAIARTAISFRNPVPNREEPPLAAPPASPSAIMEASTKTAPNQESETSLRSSHQSINLTSLFKK